MTNETEYLQRAKTFFNALNKNTMDEVDRFYDPAVVFQDPLVTFSNRDELKAYYVRLYQSVRKIRFMFTYEISESPSCAFSWQMELVSDLNKQQPLWLDGISIISFGGPEGKAVYHRDYYDMGAFVYEHIPVVRGVIKTIKKKLLTH